MRKPFFSSFLFHRRSPALFRPLYQKAERHNCNQEIVIGNNTALFATLASIDQHKTEDHQNVTLFCPPFWLDDVHSSHFNQDWGQNIYGLPWYVRKLFLEFHPRYPEDKFITWQHFNELRQIALDKLKQNGVQIHNEIPMIHKNGDVLEVTTKTGISLDYNLHDTFVYNWYKVPRSHQIEGLIQRSNTDLYKIEPKELPDSVIVLGYSLSAVWLKKHFPMINLYYLKRKNDRLPQIISNYGVPYQEIESNTFNLEDVEIAASQDQTKLQILMPNKNSSKIIIGDFYCAMGIRLMAELTDKIFPADRQLLVPEYHFTDWKAPETVAFGSLSESFSRIMSRTNNCYWAFEPMAYHLDTFPELVKEKMLEIDITLDSKFFNEFEATFVNHKAFQLGKTPLYNDSISTDKFISLFVRVYRDVYKSDYSTDVLEKDLRRIELTLKSFIENRDKKRLDSATSKVNHSRSFHTLANSGNSNQNWSDKKRTLENNMESTDQNKRKFSKKIPTKALIDALNQCDNDSFISIDKKQIERALVEHEHSLTHDSFY